MRALLLIVLSLVSLPALSSYTKIANNGSDLPASAVLGSGVTQWACTRDNATGLVWEVKTADGGLRDLYKTYTNYDGNYGTQSQINAAENSLGFANAANSSNLCGSAGWRMPSKNELLGLVNTSYTPTIDPSFFPNTRSWIFWSGSPYAGGSGSAWFVAFNDGNAYYGSRDGGVPVRLVRSGQSFGTMGTATEYYHAGFGHYFVTGSADEAAAIDSGAIKGWARTGQTYSVSQGGAGLSPVCRFFTTSFAPKSSHFYTPSAAECGSVKTNPNWQFEGNAFYVNEPTGGACQAGTAPLYRIYNNGRSGAPNHRYTTCTNIRDNMISRGWVSEGVAMCVPGGSTNCTVDNSGGGVNYSGGTPIPPVAPLPTGYVVQGGLTWMPNAIPTVPQMYTYAQATALCAGTINGQTGWRLPTRNELSALYVSGAAYPRGDVMAMLQWPWVLSHNWSSTSYPYLAGLHYIVHLGSGNVDALYDSMGMLVTCVR